MPTHFHIVGGGPAGFATALLLSKDGHTSTVYESRASVVHDPEESYPIGVNARGMHTLELIDPALAAACRDTGMVINAWQIFGGKMKVAEQESGVVYGTSRGSGDIFRMAFGSTQQAYEVSLSSSSRTRGPKPFSEPDAWLGLGRRLGDLSDTVNTLESRRVERRYLPL